MPDTMIEPDAAYCCGASPASVSYWDVHTDDYGRPVGFAVCDDCGHYYDEPVALDD